MQVGFYLFVFLRFVLHKPEKSFAEPGRHPGISVVICARNEKDNLEKNLPEVLGQDYPEFEVIVVNDASDDGSSEVLSSFAASSSLLKIFNIAPEEKKRPGKKQALTKGIQAASHEIVLLTDADCRPLSEQWINRMAAHFSDKSRDIVMGYGAYAGSNSLLNYFIRFDTAYVAMQYFSFALAGQPYMATGRNMAYRKSLFKGFGGFADHEHISSGDDDLFVNRAARAGNVDLEYSVPAHTVSVPEQKWGDFFRQKLRHYTTGMHYRFRHQLMLFLLHSSHAFFIAGIIVLIPYVKGFHLIYPLIISRFFLQMLIFKVSLKKLGENNLWLFFPFFDVFFAIFNPVIVLLSQFISKKKWT